MNGRLSKLGTALTVVFAVTLAALVAQLFFLLWRRRKSRFPTRIGPHEAHHSNQPPSSLHRNIDVDVDEAFKWQQGLYGVSSRVLFTIAEEEEREGLDSETPTTTYSSCVEKEAMTATTVVLDVAVTVTVEVEEETPPFTTPCASPPYYTPSPSPSRDFVV
ncbi:hypothetical protein ACFX15_013470 [Malus domestica]